MVAQHFRWDFVGLSTDTKPTPETSEKVVDGSTFYCSDTSKLYVFCKDDWYERKPLGGGGGGTTYTAGDGITIADDTISVDTTTIQEKLTAGTGIDITGNTISATGGGSGPTVVQTTGTSTTDVMSQNAVTSMVFADPATQEKIKIGAGTSTSEGSDGIEIGHLAAATGTNTVAIGRNAQAIDYTGSIALGANCNVAGQGSIALGASSGGNATTQGVMYINATNTAYGYNSSNYRLLTGLYDPQNAHDAATKGYVDTLVGNVASALNAINNGTGA